MITKKCSLLVGFFTSIVLLSSAIYLTSCGSSDDETTSSPETVSEIAGDIISGSVNSSSQNGTLAMYEPRSGWDKIKMAFRLIPEAFASTACPTLSTSSCSGSTITMTYSACSFGSSHAVWDGSQVLTFTSGSCTTSPLSHSVTFTRTFGSGTTRTNANGVVVSVNTTTESGYATPVAGGTTIVSDGAGARTITISGINLSANKTFTTKKGKQKTVNVWNHTVSTPSGLSVTGAGSVKTISTGTVTVQHNLAKYTGSVSISQALSFTLGCCHPTAGQLTTTLTGSKTGTETLTYSSTCGEATLVDSTGASSTVTLSNCI